MNTKIKAVEIPANQDSVADATNAVETVVIETGKSQVVGFRFMKEWVHVTLKNGVSGLVGTTEQFSFKALLTLKGTGMECRYERGKDRKGYKTYYLTWSLE
jgi:hypothetical protein